MNQRWSRLGLWAVVSQLILVVSSGQALEKRQLDDLAEIQLPSLASLEKSPKQLPDFSLYYVKRKGKNIVGIYIGNAPTVNPEKLTFEYDFGGCVGRVSEEISASGTNLDAVVELREQGFPKFIHFFSRGLSKMEVDEVHQIWRSFRLEGGLRC